jgi:hypothetical protein
MNKKRIDSEEYDRFNSALKKVLSVPHSEMKTRLAEEKQKRIKQSSSRASSDSPK